MPTKMAIATQQDQLILLILTKITTEMVDVPLSFARCELFAAILTSRFVTSPYELIDLFHPLAPFANPRPSLSTVRPYPAHSHKPVLRTAQQTVVP